VYAKPPLIWVLRLVNTSPEQLQPIPVALANT
jgi:hypothetical protein